MKFNKKLVASATTAALGMMAAGSAQASNLGEFWATDQENGRLHIWDQSNLNDPTAPSNPTIIDLTSDTGGGTNGAGFTNHAGSNHIIGFSNHAGLDPASRTVLTFLNGWVEIYETNGGTHAPVKVAELEASTVGSYAAEGMGFPASYNPPKKSGNTTHACGGNPQNDQIQCASIFNADFALFSAHMPSNTYTRIGIYKTGNLSLSPALDAKGKKGLKKKVQDAYDGLVSLDGDNQPNNICSQYSADGNLLYLAVQNNPIDGGVIVLDVSDPHNPTILDAFNNVMAAGCGLVNDPDGQHLWITHGFNKQGDPEEMSIWKYSNAGNRHGPVARITLPDADGEHPVYGGDAHGAQFAGLTNSFMWQTMRVDDNIHVISNPPGKKGARLVNTIDLDRPGRDNTTPDVLDRSALGTRMYHTTRGATPNTAISTYYFSDRNGESGVDTLATVFGYDGTYVKTSSMASGNTEHLCPGVPFEVKCAAGSAGAVEVDTTDPHGGKSLNYLSGF